MSKLNMNRQRNHKQVMATKPQKNKKQLNKQLKQQQAKFVRKMTKK